MCQTLPPGTENLRQTEKILWKTQENLLTSLPLFHPLKRFRTQANIQTPLTPYIGEKLNYTTGFLKSYLIISRETFRSSGFCKFHLQLTPTSRPTADTRSITLRFLQYLRLCARSETNKHGDCIYIYLLADFIYILFLGFLSFLLPIFKAKRHPHFWILPVPSSTLT